MTVQRCREPVTAMWPFDEQPRTRDPPLRGAGPAGIRAALLPRGPGRVRHGLRRCRGGRAASSTGAAGHRPDATPASSRRSCGAAKLTGRPVHSDEPLAQTRRTVGMQ